MAEVPLLQFDGVLDEQPGTPGIETITNRGIDKCIEGLSETIVEVLASKSPNKFLEVSRLCHIGQQIVKTKAKTVEDFVGIEGGQIQPGYGYNGANVVYGGGLAVYPQMGAARRLGHIGGRDNYDMADGGARRDALAIEPAMQVARELGASNTASNEANELKTLLELKDKVPEDKRAIIDNRINLLLESVETRNHAHAQRAQPEPQVQPPIPPVGVFAMVPAHDARRHLVGAQGPVDNAREGVRADVGGGGGPGGAAEARHEDEPPRQQAVGE